MVICGQGRPWCHEDPFRAGASHSADPDWVARATGSWVSRPPSTSRHRGSRQPRAGCRERPAWRGRRGRGCPDRRAPAATVVVDNHGQVVANDRRSGRLWRPIHRGMSVVGNDSAPASCCPLPLVRRRAVDFGARYTGACRSSGTTPRPRHAARFPLFGDVMFHPLNTITAYKGQIIYDTPATEAKSETPLPESCSTRLTRSRRTRARSSTTPRPPRPSRRRRCRNWASRFRPPAIRPFVNSGPASPLWPHYHSEHHGCGRHDSAHRRYVLSSIAGQRAHFGPITIPNITVVRRWWTIGRAVDRLHDAAAVAGGGRPAGGQPAGVDAGGRSVARWTGCMTPPPSPAGEDQLEANRRACARRRCPTASRPTRRCRRPRRCRRHRHRHRYHLARAAVARQPAGRPAGAAGPGVAADTATATVTT